MSIAGTIKGVRIAMVVALVAVLVFGVVPIGNQSVEAAAKKTVKKYTVSFDSNGGGPIFGAKTVVSKTKVKSGYKAYPVGYAEKLGYEFVGWFSKAKGGTNYSKKYATKGIKVKRDITFYAHWQLKKGYKRVTFNANGGQAIEKHMIYVGKKPKEIKLKVSVSTKGIKKGKKLGALPEVVAREGYAFLGWFSAKEGGTEITSATKLNSNKTYYAQWEAIAAQPPTDGGAVTNEPIV